MNDPNLLLLRDFTNSFSNEFILLDEREARRKGLECLNFLLKKYDIRSFAEIIFILNKAVQIISFQYEVIRIEDGEG